MTRRALALIAALALVTGSAFASGMVAGSLAAERAPADITVMPCSAWANDARPKIPANTLTDACVDERGTLHTAPTSLEKTR